VNGGTHKRILVAAIGNPNRGDDGIGLLVAEHLATTLPSDVSLLTRSGDMLGLIEDWTGYDVLICVDAAAPMGAPGRICRIDAAAGELPSGLSPTSSHAFGLAEAISLALTLGAMPQQAVVYAVEGACFDVGASMTQAVTEAAAEVARDILGEVCRIVTLDQKVLRLA
jgi:hydrogenase maturation protease